MESYQEDLDIVTRAVNALGHERINPESLTALQDYAITWGWTVLDDVSSHTLYATYTRVVASFRALFAPL